MILDSALNCLDKAVEEWNLDKASQLRQYAQNFSMENYNKNLKLFITNWIESHSHLFKKKKRIVDVDEYLHPFIINTMIQPQIIATVKHVPSLTIHNFFLFFT